MFHITLGRADVSDGGQTTDDRRRESGHRTNALPNPTNSQWGDGKRHGLRGRTPRPPPPRRRKAALAAGPEKSWQQKGTGRRSRGVEHVQRAQPVGLMLHAPCSMLAACFCVLRCEINRKEVDAIESPTPAPPTSPRVHSEDRAVQRAVKPLLHVLLSLFMLEYWSTCQARESLHASIRHAYNGVWTKIEPVTNALLTGDAISPPAPRVSADHHATRQGLEGTSGGLR